MESWIRSAGWLVCMAVAPWSAVSADGRIKQRLPFAGGDVREPAWGPFIE